MPDFEKIVIANWKMKLGVKESLDLAESFKKSLGDTSLKELVVCPDFLSLAQVGQILDNTSLKLGSQDMFWEESGSYTGEVSPRNLKGLGCSYTILGHSERRQYLSEDYQMINRKLRAALDQGLSPIMCIGETKQDKEEGRRDEVLESQLRQGLENVKFHKDRTLIVAYEPVWAIGSGEAIEEKDIQEAYKVIKLVLKGLFEEDADNVLTIYGGSVTSENVDRFSNSKEIDGLLLGGASLKAEEFFKIAQSMLK